MSKETIYPEGVRAFSPRNNAPDFVKGTVLIEPNKLFAWLKKEGAEHLTEYNGEKQLKLQLLEGKKGLYLSVDTFKPESGGKKQEEDILPF